MRVGTVLHNYVINADNLNFRDIADNNLDTLEVEPTVEWHEGSRGFLELVDDGVDNNVDDNDRRDYIVSQKKKGVCFVQSK